MPLSAEERLTVRKVAALIVADPTILNEEAMIPLRDAIVALGATVPASSKAASATAKDDSEDEPISVGPVGPAYEAPQQRDDIDAEAAATFKAEAAQQMAEGNLDGALTSMNAALRANPNSAFTWAARADLHLRLHKLAEAIADANVAMRLNPDSARALRVLGRCYAERKMWVEAADCLNSAQNVDFSEDVAEILKAVQPAALAARDAARQKARPKSPPAPSPPPPREEAMPPLVPPGMEELFGELSRDPEMMNLMRDPVVMSKLAELQSRPDAIMSMMTDPVLAPFVSKLMGRFAGRMPGAPAPPQHSPSPQYKPDGSREKSAAPQKKAEAPMASAADDLD